MLNPLTCLSVCDPRSKVTGMSFVFSTLRIMFAIFCVVILGVIFVSSPKDHTRIDIEIYAKELFEFGSVEYVHSLESPRKDGLAAVFDQVANGQPLSATLSSQYRNVYAAILQDNATRFSVVDQDLQMAVDFGMDTQNNCGQFGITGEHDLHDMSAKNNYADIQKNLNRLRSGAGFFNRIYLINDINKDLVDLMVHMAPAVHSVGVRDVTFSFDGESTFDRMQAAFKTAQFSDVNSRAYWIAVDSALILYADIVEDTQDMISAHSSSMERRIAGRWLAIQTIAPRLEKTDQAFETRRNSSR